jgi:hypothetical protein
MSGLIVADKSLDLIVAERQATRYALTNATTVAWCMRQVAVVFAAVRGIVTQ